MFGGKDKKNTGMKKMDKLVTGLIIGGVVASMFGVASQTKQGKKFTAKLKDTAFSGLRVGGRALANIVSLLSKKK